MPSAVTETTRLSWEGYSFRFYELMSQETLRLTREIFFRYILPCLLPGITQAGAGKMHRHGVYSGCGWKHPRLRGEDALFTLSA
jgi:hypothetical protein